MSKVKENKQFRKKIRELIAVWLFQKYKRIKQIRSCPKARKIQARKIHTAQVDDAWSMVMVTYTLLTLRQKFTKYQEIARQNIHMILSLYQRLVGAFKALFRTLNQNGRGLILSSCLLKNSHFYSERSLVYDFYMSKSNLKNFLLKLYCDIHPPMSSARCSRGYNLLKPGY
jgi:hypothetical protein